MTCSTCKHATEWETLTAHETGFYVCAFGQKYEYRAGRMECMFEPSRWEMKMMATVQRTCGRNGESFREQE